MERGDALASKRDIKRINAGIEAVNSEVRDLIANFRAPIDEGGLLPSIEGMVHRFEDVPAMTAVLARLAQGDAVPHTGSRFAELTPREIEILGHVAAGQGNKAIARDLGITDGTVKLHVRSIMKKLHLKSRVEAAVLAVEEGLSRKS